jgi:hypothetical protein
MISVGQGPERVMKIVGQPQRELLHAPSMMLDWCHVQAGTWTQCRRSSSPSNKAAPPGAVNTSAGPQRTLEVRCGIRSSHP